MNKKNTQKNQAKPFDKFKQLVGKVLAVPKAEIGVVSLVSM
jgi:hypothetical protein